MRHAEAAKELADLPLSDLEAIADEILPQYRCYKLPRTDLEAMLTPLLVMATTAVPYEQEPSDSQIQYHPTPVVGWYERDNKGKGSYSFKHLA